MKSPNEKQHNFSSKLCQSSILPFLKEYVEWQQNKRKGIASDSPSFGPISINLDLTTACNFACPHCVDSGIINTGEFLPTETIKDSIRTLRSKGLKSVIIIGGGEPTLHKDFKDILLFIKSQDLQVGIVTNGTKLNLIKDVASCLKKNDWLRLSIDAARQDTFNASHRPKREILLTDMLSAARDIKNHNPDLSLGYSFVIVWEGVSLNGHQLQQNVSEMAEAAQMAKEHDFDYISFKPCLIRLPQSQKETLLHGTDKDTEEFIRRTIQNNLEKARDISGDRLFVSESVNLQALLKNEVVKLKSQPQTCHMQFFRTVLAPSGICHCPAFRGVDKAIVGKCTGYAGEENFSATMRSVAESVETFDAKAECSDVGCFYNDTNHWIEALIQDEAFFKTICEVKDHNFFL